MNKLAKRLVATVLTVSMAVSMISISTISSSAVIALATLDGFATNQLYSRCLTTAGSIISSLGEYSGNATVQKFTSFINEKVCGNSSANAKIQETCDKILNTVEDMNAVVKSINSKIEKEAMRQRFTEYSDAWSNQVLGVLKANDTNTSFYGVYDAYINYLAYANGSKELSAGKTLEYYEQMYVSELESFYSRVSDDSYNNNSILNKDEYYKYKMFASDEVDQSIFLILSTMLYNMNSEKNSLGHDKNLGYRFIDRAAQYAYYAFPFGDEQAEFIDMSVEYQINMVTTLVMIYQDFLARKAEYYSDLNYIYNKFLIDENNVNVQTLSDEDKAIYDRLAEIKEEASSDSSKNAAYQTAINNIKANYSTIDACNKTFAEYYDAKNTTADYVGMLDKYQDNMTSFLNGDIYLTDFNAYAKLDKYPRKSSVTARNNDKKDSFILKNEKHRESYLYDGNHGSQTKFSNGNVSFYKNVAAKIKNGEVVFTPFYVLNGDAKDLSMSNLDILRKCANGTLFGGIWNAHYLAIDYHNFKDGVFTDGINKYATVTDPNQLKDLVNDAYYSANTCNNLNTYFSSYMDYANGKQNYLLVNGKTKLHNPAEGVEYTEISAFNMSSSKDPSSNWGSEMIDYEDFDNAVYSLVLIPQSSERKVKIDSKINGEGEVSISNNTPLVGDKVKVSITVPENYIISNIKVQCHNDVTDPSKVSDEIQICAGVETNTYTNDLRVPYSNATIVVETKAIEKALDVDQNGNYIVSSYDDLCQMATMVNSGYSAYVQGNYVLTKSINASGKKWANPIGTEAVPFSGTFDAQGNSIISLNFDDQSKVADLGLFGVINGGSVENLGIDLDTPSVAKKHTNIGAVCGKLKNGTISNCNITGFLASYSDYLGGIVGTATDSTIKNCLSGLLLYSNVNTDVNEICSNAANLKVIDCTVIAEIVKYNA